MSELDYPYDSYADLPGVAFGAMRQVILTQAKAAGLVVLKDQPGDVTVQTVHGLIGLRPGGAAETAGMVAARDPRWLFIMKNAVVEQMRQLMPDVAKAMRWSDGDVEGALPPNFQFVTATRVAPLGSAFLRVTLEGDGFASFGDTAIHFRLVQPPEGAEPVWPSLAPNGSIRWPEGPGAPHMPVYTVRHVDHAANALVTDVFVHEGGRTTAWAEAVMAGARERRVVGLVGPSGGGLLHADDVLMATDETGFPAAARLLENLPDGATGTVILEAEEGEACGYPITAPNGITVNWLARSRGERLIDAALAGLSQRGSETAIWFAGEQQDARRLRETATAAGWTKQKLRISSFWKAER
ncbi:MAG: siderophore-interacting protein [Pseudomonadota bacterium]